MSGKKKNRNQDKATTAIILITAIIQLVIRLIEFIDHLTS